MTRLAIAAVFALGGVAHADTKTIAKEVARVRGISLKKPLDDAQLASYADPAIDGAPEDAVFVHRIAHALEAQRFEAPVGEPADDEATARRALSEGDALVTTFEVLLARKDIDPPWRDPALVTDVARRIARPSDRAGFRFVAELRADKPWSAIDAVFKRPPRSTEQLLHVDKYIADEKPVAVDAPVLDGFTALSTTTWGELGFAQWLRAHGIDAERAAIAAAGWGGDKVATFAPLEHTDRPITVARLAWDTEVDASEAYDALVVALDDMRLAARAEHCDTRTTWLALDGTISYVRRTETTIDLAIGLPATKAN